MMQSDDNVEELVNKLRTAATSGKWSKALDLFKAKREVRLAKITETGDTVLHMAVSSRKEHVVESMVDFLCRDRTNERDRNLVPLSCADENGDEEHVLGALNNKGNTPLHEAAIMGNAEMCKKMGGARPSIIAKRNKFGETPLFMAALHGKTTAFLWLHYQYTGSPRVSFLDVAHCIRRNNNDTILHCAIAKGHIDVAIEIVLLYKHHLEEMTVMHNKNGLSPLHLSAVTPLAFESTHPPTINFVSHLLYRWKFLRVKKKQATTREELERGERKPCIEACGDAILRHGWNRLDDLEGSSCAAWIRNVAVSLLCFLAVILLIPLKLAEMLFHKIRTVKEQYGWSLQIVEELLLHAPAEYMSVNPYEEDSVAGSKIVDTPLIIAAKNGVVEMVEKILEYFPHTMRVVNEEGKNIVLLAAENRQTKLYQILCGNEKVDKSSFWQVDKDGNTALHLAAKPGLHLNLETTTMVEEFKWFEFVKRSLPSELCEKYNNDGKTAEEIFRDSYKEHMTSDRQWLNHTSQTCSLASTLVASMAFSFIVSDKFDENNYSSLVALSLSLTSTISFLAIIAFRSQSLNFWRYAPFMLQIAILTMFGSIVALWITLMRHGKSLTTYSILGTPIAVLTIVSLPIFIGPTLMSLFTKVPPPNRYPSSAIHYRKP